MAGKTETEQQIYDFMYSNYPSGGKLDYLDRWLEAREGNLIIVFIEYLETFNKCNYLTKEERMFIDDLRCLKKKDKQRVISLKDEIYIADCKERSEKKTI